MANLKVATLPNSNEDVEKLDYSYTVGGNVKYKITLENNLAVS